MTTISLKPILFQNFLKKYNFLRKNNLKNIFFNHKSLLVYKYNPESFKNIFNRQVKANISKNNGTFLIISNKQLSFISSIMHNYNYNIIDIKKFSKIRKNKFFSIENIYDEERNYSLDDLYKYFNEEIRLSNLYKLVLSNGPKMVEIMGNGVITFKNINNDNINKYLIEIQIAYSSSQK